MNEIKDRYQFIIGFAAIVISLSAFKDELKAIVIDYQFVSFSLSQYLFTLIISFIVIIHIYVIPYVFSTTKYANWKVFKHLESLSYFLFVILILSPSLLLIAYLAKLLLVQIASLEERSQKITMSIILSILGFILGLLSNYIVTKYRSTKKSKEQIEIQETEIKSFETAERLIKDDYYNQAILESFKILEMGLYKALRIRDLVFRRGSFLEMINISRKYNIFSSSDIEKINEIRIKRNEIAHNLGIKATKKDAEETLALVKKILAVSEEKEISIKE